LREIWDHIGIENFSDEQVIKALISIIVVTDTPKSIGMSRMLERTRSGQTCWKASFARCSMVTVRLGDYSYCAVAEISHKYLLELISRLLS